MGEGGEKAHLSSPTGFLPRLLQKLTQPALQHLRTLRFTFPNNRNAPAKLAQRSPDFSIPYDIRIELVRPEFSASFRHGRLSASRVPMPKAAVHK